MVFVFSVCCLLTSLVLSFLIIPLLIDLLTKKGVLDVGGRRKIHKGKKPSMGGVAIFAGFMFSSLAWVPWSEVAYFRYFFIGMILMFLTGLYDDRLDLKAKYKFIVQVLIAVLVVWGGGEKGIRVPPCAFDEFFGTHALSGTWRTVFNYLWPVMSYATSIFLIVGVVNAFNLIDGFDGLAGTIGIISFTLLAVWLLAVGDTQNHGWSMGLMLVALVGGVAAFLYHNWQPSTIFMGDTGSLTLGFILAVSILKFMQINSDPDFVSDFRANAPVSMGCAFAIVPIFDTLRIFAVRISKGRSPFSPDKLHIHHLLSRSMKLAHWQIAMFMGALHLLLMALIFLLARILPDFLLIILIILICVGLHFLLGRVINLTFFASKWREKRRKKESRRR
ncbi:MAG: undecaprenyl/decaprenyl-phosphate alpha-N-acetylglucosaminyl 1-phosphate transferase [Prevotellaceae bacterium]|jgi:UDP-N-acetylmuramyl pentapeptide phosphotransferase/UDP-N-acetylglucosamine-1-phosphate transferase|nr:undecaprenyl/decaprenyl-phosphate alpha-N-acetylglucosaminyl 1-phosphate transferase [Prevotellaceae bacterium]